MQLKWCKLRPQRGDDAIFKPWARNHHQSPSRKVLLSGRMTRKRRRRRNFHIKALQPDWISHSVFLSVGYIISQLVTFSVLGKQSYRFGWLIGSWLLPFVIQMYAGGKVLFESWTLGHRNQQPDLTQCGQNRCRCSSHMHAIYIHFRVMARELMVSITMAGIKGVGQTKVYFIRSISIYTMHFGWQTAERVNAEI